MSVLVVDASVAVKWFLPETHAEAARRVLGGRRQLLAPDLIWAEIGNVLWKKCRRVEVAGDEARRILDDFRQFPIRITSAKPLLDPAWDIAVRFDLSVYDSLYVALAVSRDCPLITADHGLYTSLKDGPLASAVLWIEHVS